MNNIRFEDNSDKFLSEMKRRKEVILEVIGSVVEYSPYVELGTIKMKAQPYLKPAISDHKSEYKSIINSGLKNE